MRHVASNSRKTGRKGGIKILNYWFEKNLIQKSTLSFLKSFPPACAAKLLTVDPTPLSTPTMVVVKAELTILHKNMV